MYSIISSFSAITSIEKNILVFISRRLVKVVKLHALLMKLANYAICTQWNTLQL